MEMVSIVIPVYNGSKYIERAINSVLSQTYREIEVIVVDDCSTDNTYDILNNFINVSNFKIIRNDKNLGVGISRKIGVENSSGEYITFLDADDYILPDFIEMSLRLAKQHDSDVVYTSIGILFPNNDMKVIEVGNYVSSNEAKFNIFFWCEMNFLTGKLFKTELLNKCHWSERRVAEDVQTLFYIIYDANKVRSFPYMGYIHVCREGSLMSYNSKEMTDVEKMEHSFNNFCYNCIAEKEMLEFLINRKDNIILKSMYDSYFSKVKSAREMIKNIPDYIFMKYKYLWDEFDNFYPKQ